MKDDTRAIREKKVNRLIEQWQRSVRAAVQGSRKDKGLTQEDAAERMAWTQDIVSNIEAGRREISVAEFIVLAQQFDIDPEVMFRRVIRW
jgi:transcriptional regulator with XRE-family HTH domain